MLQSSPTVNKQIIPLSITPIKITICNFISKSLFCAVIYLYTKVIMTSGYFQTCQKQLKVTAQFNINASKIVNHTTPIVTIDHFVLNAMNNESNLTERTLN